MNKLLEENMTSHSIFKRSNNLNTSYTERKRFEFLLALQTMKILPPFWQHAEHSTLLQNFHGQFPVSHQRVSQDPHAQTGQPLQGF